MRVPCHNNGLSASITDLANAIYRQEGPTQNNNPGNLRYVGQAGATGQDSRGFAIFPTLAAGQAAEVSQIQLIQSRGTCATGAAVNTVSDLINCLSPPSENNTSAYVANVANWTGLSPDTPLSSLTSSGMTLDLSTDIPDTSDTAIASGIDFSDPTTIAVAVGAALTLWFAFA